jgi:hypothetical protein
MALVSSSPAELSLRTALLQKAQSIIETRVEELVQAERLGLTYSFVAGKPLFEKTIGIYQLLASANLELVGEARLRQLTDFTDQVLTQFSQFKAFQQQPNAQFGTQERDARLRTFVTLFDQVFGLISSVLAISQPERLAQYESEAKTSAENMTRFVEAQKKGFEDYRREAEKEVSETIAKTKQAAQEVGITRYEVFFRTEANGHRKMATIWLVATVLLAVATGMVGWFNYNRTLAILQTAVSTAPPAEAAGHTVITIQLTIAKLIMFSILFSAVLWAGRIYRAHRHNYVVNKHRQNALSTFEAFVKATEDGPTKNAVLLQATQCIFGPQTTGYLPQEKESETPTQIFEFIRGASSAKS